MGNLGRSWGDLGWILASKIAQDHLKSPQDRPPAREIILMCIYIYTTCYICSRRPPPAHRVGPAARLLLLLFLLVLSTSSSSSGKNITLASTAQRRASGRSQVSGESDRDRVLLDLVKRWQMRKTKPKDRTGDKLARFEWINQMLKRSGQKMLFTDENHLKSEIGRGSNPPPLWIGYL